MLQPSRGTSSALLPVALAALLALTARAAAPPPLRVSALKRQSNPLGIDLDPAPSAEDGPPGARNAIRDPAYLPAQISGIVGSYAFSLVLVAIILLALSKRRRERLQSAEDFEVWEEPHFAFDFPEPVDSVFRSQDDLQPAAYPFQVAEQSPKSPGHARNFSLPSPTSTTFQAPVYEAAQSYTLPSPSSSRGPLGIDPEVDQEVVLKDRAMAQAQLEDMYKYVMEQEAAKQAGVEFRGPELPAPPQQPEQQQQQRSSSSILKKGRIKPANLNLGNGEKKESRTSSILSALKSPGRRKKQPQGLNISSPIMTPMSGTFPQYAGEEMNTIPPRQYAPAPPPPVPASSNSYLPFDEGRNTGHMAPLTPPDQSPESTQSIDERLRTMAGGKGKDREVYREDDNVSDSEEQQQQQSVHGSRHISVATTEADPISATSDTSQTPLFRASGLPTSPKPGVNRFPSLPSSPKPGATTFSRPNAPSAVRTGGTLPLRAYEPALMSPNTYDRTVKQTVFERAPGPRTPGLQHTARTPLTGNPVPYSPYQPFSPVVPITPSLVTKADRKNMRRMEPKTPTLQMVKSDDELW